MQGGTNSKEEKTIGLQRASLHSPQLFDVHP
jgi:hypothetical protein